jgi:hypothetical protein
VLKSECTTEQWEVFAEKRRHMDASADRPIDGAAYWLAKYWGKIRVRGRLPAKPSRYLTGDSML